MASLFKALFGMALLKGSDTKQGLRVVAFSQFQSMAEGYNGDDYDDEDEIEPMLPTISCVLHLCEKHNQVTLN